MALVTVINYRHLPPQVPLFYSHPTAGTQIVDTWYLALLPILSIVLVVCNSLFLQRFVRGESLGEYIIYISNLVVIVSLSYIYIQIILLIT